MDYDKTKAHYIVVTAILHKLRRMPDELYEWEYLIVKRSEREKVFPNLWTVPSGKIETNDYVTRTKDTHDCWYNVIEDALSREVMEEVNIDISYRSITYVASMAFFRPDKIPTICMRFAVEILNDVNINLCDDLTEFVWVTLKEAKEYELIEGIWEEIQKFDQQLKRWKKELK